MQHSEYLKRCEVAAKTGLSQSLFEKLAVIGGGPPYIRVGRAVRYRWPDVEAWLISRAAGSTSEHDRRAGVR